MRQLERERTELVVQGDIVRKLERYRTELVLQRILDEMNRLPELSFSHTSYVLNWSAPMHPPLRAHYFIPTSPSLRHLPMKSSQYHGGAKHRSLRLFEIFRCRCGTKSVWILLLHEYWDALF